MLTLTRPHTRRRSSTELHQTHRYTLNPLTQINIMVDVVNVLASQTLDPHLYVIDNHHGLGSHHQSTNHLLTCLRPQDEIIWSVESLMPHAPCTLQSIEIDPNVMTVTTHTLPDSNQTYLKGIIKQRFDILPYQLTLAIGTTGTLFSSQSHLTLQCRDER